MTAGVKGVDMLMASTTRDGGGATKAKEGDETNDIVGCWRKTREGRRRICINENERRFTSKIHECDDVLDLCQTAQ
jgi:hypothetical protein